MKHEGFRIKSGAEMGKVRGFVCMQCALKQFVAQLESGADPMLEPPAAVWVDATIDEHLAEFHPDEAATQRERDDLEARATAGFDALMRRRRAGVDNAKNN